MAHSNLEQRFWAKVSKSASDECWLWTAARSRHGYGVIRLGGAGNGNILAHRLSWELHNGPTGGLYVLHRCDVPACVNPNHLFLGTQADNMKDMFRKGRGEHVRVPDHRGTRNPMARLSDEDIKEIRTLAGQWTQRAIAARFDIDPSHVCKIVRGQRR